MVVFKCIDIFTSEGRTASSLCTTSQTRSPLTMWNSGSRWETSWNYVACRVQFGKVAWKERILKRWSKYNVTFTKMFRKLTATPVKMWTSCWWGTSVTLQTRRWGKKPVLPEYNILHLFFYWLWITFFIIFRWWITHRRKSTQTSLGFPSWKPPLRMPPMLSRSVFNETSLLLAQECPIVKTI